MQVVKTWEVVVGTSIEVSIISHVISHCKQEYCIHFAVTAKHSEIKYQNLNVCFFPFVISVTVIVPRPYRKCITEVF